MFFILSLSVYLVLTREPLELTRVGQPAEQTFIVFYNSKLCRGLSGVLFSCSGKSILLNCTYLSVSRLFGVGMAQCEGRPGLNTIRIKLVICLNMTECEGRPGLNTIRIKLVICLHMTECDSRPGLNTIRIKLVICCT